MSINDIAALIARHVPAPNPLFGAVITTDLGLVDGAPIVLVRVGDATRRATYLPPYAVQLGNCFVARLDATPTAPLVIFSTNYQVPVAGGATGWGASWDSSAWGA